MENVRIAILNENNILVGFMDNGLPEALHYFNETLNVYLQGTAHTFTWTVPTDHADAAKLKVGAKVSFKYKKKAYYLNIVETEQNEYTLTCTAYSLAFELLNEQTPAYHGTPQTDTASARVLGSSVKSVSKQYALNNSTTAPADDAFSGSFNEPTSEKKYAWCYEKITFTNNTQTTTAKRIVSTWVTGRVEGSTFTEYYGLSANSSTQPTTWEKKLPETLSGTLWSYSTCQFYVNTAKTFAEYLAIFDPNNTATIYKNQISGTTLVLDWTETSTILERLYSLAERFGAEIEFVPVLGSNYSLEQIRLNVYLKYDDEFNGIGNYRSDVVVQYGKNLDGVTRSLDITRLFSSIRPSGKDGIGLYGFLPAGTTGEIWTELDENGNVAFSLNPTEGIIRAVQAARLFPAHATGSGDQYILEVFTSDADTQQALFEEALAELKKICEPIATYDYSGYIDVNIGDTVKISDEAFEPPLYLLTRVNEQRICFTDQDRNLTVFTNTRELQSQVDNSLSALTKKLRTYTIASSNGTTFKNKTGTTILRAVIS